MLSDEHGSCRKKLMIITSLFRLTNSVPECHYTNYFNYQKYLHMPR